MREKDTNTIQMLVVPETMLNSEHITKYTSDTYSPKPSYLPFYTTLLRPHLTVNPVLEHPTMPALLYNKSLAPKQETIERLECLDISLHLSS